MTDPWGTNGPPPPPPPLQQQQQPTEPYGTPQQAPYGLPGQSPQPYLERNPYGQLSEQNLDQQAAYQQQQGYGGVQASPSPYGQPPYGSQPGAPGEAPYGSQPGGGGYGPPPYGSQPGAYGYAPPGYYPRKQSNGLALAGAITSFVPVVGLVLSIIGRVRASALGGVGKTAGTIGIVLSLLFTGGFGFVVYKVANSTAADPGCISAESTGRNMVSEIDSDGVAINNAVQAGNQSQLTSAREKLLTDMTGVKADLDSALAQAGHANVRAVIQRLDNDLGQFVAAGHQFIAGADNGTTMEKILSQMQTDGDAVDSLCRNAVNG